MQKKSKSPHRRKTRNILLIILGVLVIARLILPSVVLKFANKTLASMHGYYGHVEDIDIALIRGAYQINNIFINKIDSVTQRQTTFFHSESIDLSIEWKALFHGAITGELVFERPMLRFTKDKTEPGDVKKDTTDFRIVLKKFMPLKINRFEINHGIIAYHDSSTTPSVSIELTETYILAENLKNVYAANDILPATVKAHAYLYEGLLSMDMRLNPLADDPTFDLNGELKNTNLVKLNEFFKAYGKFDVHRGNFGLFTEMAARDGKFKGYVKPVIKDLDVLGPEDRKDNILQKIWEGTVGLVGVVFRNQKKDQVATKVPIEGDFKNPKTGVVDAVVQVVINAFIQALVPAIDDEINLKSISTQSEEKKTFFQKLFSKKDKADSKKKK
ncbi:MAG: DUF748 domain-containing protein [Bacteroidota bacterium]